MQSVLRRNQKQQLDHHVHQLRVRYQRPNPQYGWFLHHVRRQSEYFQDREGALGSQSAYGYHADEVRWMAHLRHRELRQVRNQSALQDEYVAPHHPTVLPPGDQVIGNQVRHRVRSPNGHGLPSSRVQQFVLPAY